MVETLREVSLIDALRYPFQISQDYTTYAETAGKIVTEPVGEFHGLMKQHETIGDSGQYRRGLELLATQAWDVVREFAELGNSSRKLEEAYLDDDGIELLLRTLQLSPRPVIDEIAATDPNWPENLQTVDGLVEEKLHIMARRAFMWGRTGDPDSEPDEPPFDATPQRIFAERDVLALGPAVGEITGDVTTAMIGANCGIFGRLALRRMPDLNQEIERFVTEELRAAVKSES